MTWLLSYSNSILGDIVINSSSAKKSLSFDDIAPKIKPEATELLEYADIFTKIYILFEIQNGPDK
jgi:hypothetical protein